MRVRGGWSVVSDIHEEGSAMLRGGMALAMREESAFTDLTWRCNLVMFLERLFDVYRQ